MSEPTYQPKFWDPGEGHDDATRKLVDDEVAAALAEYLQDSSCLRFGYRLGGSPTISFSLHTNNFDDVPGAVFRCDLGDKLFEALEESRECGPSVMADLFAALFEVYERWRAARTASDPACSIPVPELVDDEAIDRSEADEAAALPELKGSDKFYRGIATCGFDGFLKEIDARGTMLRGKLVLSAGGAEIDCVMNKERVPEARESFDKRVIIEGKAHYDGINQIPSRIDVRTIKILKEDADLLRWRGTFRALDSNEVDDDDW
jgi:hypothetical protein